MEEKYGCSNSNVNIIKETVNKNLNPTANNFSSGYKNNSMILEAPLNLGINKKDQQNI
jgi:hypothetical protein